MQYMCLGAIIFTFVDALQVGEGMDPGEDAFLVWDVPQNRIHSINCMAVSTARGSEGQWEFIEYICEYSSVNLFC